VSEIISQVEADALLGGGSEHLLGRLQVVTNFPGVTDGGRVVPEMTEQAPNCPQPFGRLEPLLGGHLHPVGYAAGVLQEGQEVFRGGPDEVFKRGEAPPPGDAGGGWPGP
jgi:hypothetical protein